MPAYISGLGTVIDLIASLVIVIKLYKPAKEVNFKYNSFRGSLYWMFILMIPFMLFMSTNLITDDVKIAGFGYVIGHIFLYLALAVYVYAPFKLIKPGSNTIPNLIAIIVALSGFVVTYINWIAYATEETLPVYDNGVTIWNPPQLVFIFIALATMILWVGLGTVIFWYHAYQTNNSSLRKRSFRIGLGLLLTAIGGPLHDAPLPGATILLADVTVAVGLIIVAWGMLTQVKTT